MSRRRRDANQKAGSQSSENGRLLFPLPLASRGWVGEETFLAPPVLAEPRRQAGRWVLCCPSPCCWRQLPSSPASWAPSARRIGTACVPGEEGAGEGQILPLGRRGWLVRGCAQPGAGLPKSGGASPLGFNLLWIVAIIIRIISSR